MVDDMNLGLGPGPARVRVLMQAGFEKLAAELESCAKNNGGELDNRLVSETIDSFRTRADEAMLDFYREGWNECLAVIENVRRETERRFPFERLMVRAFSHLLPAAQQSVIPGRGLSRRVLPGFLSALQQMLGPVLLEQYQDRCRELVRIIQTARGRDFVWEDVYADPTSQVIVNDVLVHISKHFADLERRRDWLIGVISGNMVLSEDETEKNWIFGEAEFSLLIDALFRPLRKQLLDPDGAINLRERYGTISCELLEDLFRELNAQGNIALLHRNAG